MEHGQTAPAGDGLGGYAELERKRSLSDTVIAHKVAPLFTQWVKLFHTY